MRVDRYGNMHGLDNDGEPMPPERPRSRIKAEDVKVESFEKDGLVYVFLTSPRMKDKFTFAITKDELKALVGHSRKYIK